jgi:hypothetical protein
MSASRRTHSPQTQERAAHGIVGLLLKLLQERWDGTLLIHDEDDQFLAALRFEAGAVAKGRTVGRADTLLRCLVSLCARADARLLLVDQSDLVGEGHGVLCGPVHLPRLRRAVSLQSGPIRRDDEPTQTRALAAGAMGRDPA